MNKKNKIIMLTVAAAAPTIWVVDNNLSSLNAQNSHHQDSAESYPPSQTTLAIDTQERVAPLTTQQNQIDSEIDPLADALADIRYRSVERRQLQLVGDEVLENAALQSDLVQATTLENVQSAFSFLSEAQLSDGRQLIQYDPYVLETRFVGDTLSIDLDSLGQTVTGLIDRIDTAPDGKIIKFSGVLENFSTESSMFRFSQVLEDNYTVGTIVTPFGEYEFEAKDGVGWIVPSEKAFYLPPNGDDTLSAEVDFRTN